jgi:Arc/MetJ-type ribon-helix-helix transcriptional regulator
MERDITSLRYQKQSISFPRTQLEWLRQEAARQEHGNVSRVVQEAVKEYRRRRLVEELERQQELETVVAQNGENAA